MLIEDQLNVTISWIREQSWFLVISYEAVLGLQSQHFLVIRTLAESIKQHCL